MNPLTNYALLVCTNSNLVELQVMYLALLCCFDINRQLWLDLNGKSLQEYPINARVPPFSILGPALFLLYIIVLLPDVICNVDIFADNATV